LEIGPGDRRFLKSPGFEIWPETNAPLNRSPQQNVEVFGVKLVGVTPENGRKLLITLIVLAGIWLIRWLLTTALSRFARDTSNKRSIFWSDQGIRLLAAAAQIIFVLSIWFDDPGRITTFLGLVTAGVAFAMQRVITSFAGYFVLLRGTTFNVGERIKMGGVRGDVMALGFMQTTIMEMGQAPAEQSDNPGMWVEGRQYTGRIVTVTNDKIFDEPVYNYSRDFPFIWEELKIGIPYNADRARAEQILLDTAQRHAEGLAEMGEAQLRELERRYFMRREDLVPRVYWRLTDNWVEMALRFITRDSGIRELKDRMSRDILADLDRAGIPIASGTYEIVGMPDLKVRVDGPHQNQKQTESDLSHSRA
jgi:small-conductance mechanosensitive channel